MLPTSFILTTAFVLFLFPQGISKDYGIKKEQAMKNNTSISIDLNLGSGKKKALDPSNNYNKVKPESNKTNSVLPSETFTEKPVQLEEWMKSPKTWNHKNEF